ncbi:MAG: HAD family hydrolase [Candidatus Marinimicrobia bacterium]|nr:HAD family hydrolase [Candidatus Neomarinimicrobiota bacterium]MBT5271487.1 HAD family hydrolase [Candidatus Neomarinimicrobiota bacterium]
MSDLANLSDWMIVFDLDDTLYQEDDYSQSGVAAVARELESLYGMDLTEQLMLVREERGDVWGKACELLDLSTTVKESMLWMYRLHHPNIELESEVLSVVHKIASSAKQLVILTDGRSATQRMKLSALDLLGYPLYISEEYESNKPEEKRFKQIMKDYVADNYVYIADNPVKDFIAPNDLGWRTIGVRDVGRNIHQQNIDNLSDKHQPDFWVDKVAEAVECL